MKNAKDNKMDTIKKLNVELSSYKSRLRESQKVSNIGSWDYNITSDDLYWSDQMFIILGYEPNEVQPNSDIVLSHIHPDDLDYYNNSIRNAIENKSNFSLENRIVSKDNIIKTVLSKGNIIYNGTGKPTRMFGIVQDITEQNILKIELKNQIAELDHMYSSAPIGIGFIDKDFKYIRVNESLALINNKSVKNHIGKTIYDILPSELARMIEPILHKVITTRTSVLNYEISFPFNNENGDKNTWLISFYPVVAGKEELRGIGVIIQDVSELSYTKEKLNILNKKLQADQVEFDNKNIALKEIIIQIDNEKKEISENIQTNIDNVIKPMLTRFEQKLGKGNNGYLLEIQNELDKLTLPYMKQIKSAYSGLSSRDIEICNYIINGKSTKEIAAIFDVSFEAIRSRRKIIRKKMGIEGDKISLAQYLLSLR